MTAREATAAAEALRAISALAVIKVNWDDDRDYIANFVPIVSHCIRRADHDEISLSETQKLIAETFGLKIPLGPLETILRRMAREELVSRIHGVYLRRSEALATFDLGSEREGVLRQHGHLVDLLRRFAADRGRTWSEEQSEKALLAYVEGLAEPILGAVLEGEPVVELPRMDAEGSVVTNQFVLDLCRREPEAFDYLVTVVKGTMLANVLFLPEAFSGGKERLKDVAVFLDTPVVLRSLGYAEPAYCEPAEELLDLLASEEADLRIFEHTLHEVEGVLDGAAASYRTGGQKDHIPGDVVDYFASKNLSRSDVELEIAELKERLDKRDIEVRGTPEHIEGLELSERDLEAALKAAISYHRHGTMVKDLNSLTAIYRLRGGAARRRIESVEALLVTTNHRLVDTSRRFFDGIVEGRSVPICLSDYSLAAMAWLMNPSQAPDLPRRQIIAISYAALNPPDEVWRRYLAEIRRLKGNGELSEEQVGLLLFSPDARLELMNATEGNAGALVTGTISEILRHAEATARSEVEEERDAERAQKEEAERAAEAGEAKAQAEAERTRSITAEHEIRIGRRARELAGFLSWCAFVVGALIMLLACVAGAEGIAPASWSRLIPVGSALVFIAVLATLVALLTGWNLLIGRRWLAGRLQPPIGRRLHRWFGDDPEEPGAEKD
jgi:hypothetical protein